MKKFIILSLVFILVLSVTSFASNTRVRTMGNNNMIVIDDANIEIFPSRLLQFPNLAIGEFNSSDFRDFGMIWKISDKNNCTMGAFFSTENTYGDFGSLPNFGSFNNSYNNRISFYYARDLGANKLGVNLRYMAANGENTSTDTASFNSLNNESLSRINLTVGLTEGSDKWDIAANIGFGSFTNERTNSYNNNPFSSGFDTLQVNYKENEPDGISNMGIEGRYFMVKNPNYTLIPHVSLQTDKFGYTATPAAHRVLYDATRTFKMTYSEIEIGVGVNFTPSSNVLAILDFGLSRSSSKYESTYSQVLDTTATPYEIDAYTDEDKYSTTTLPYFKLGLDAEVFKWLDVRFGVQSDWHREKNENEYRRNLNPFGFPDYYLYNSESKSNYVYNETMVGLGFNWNRLHIDTEANPDFFIEGPDFLSGASEDMAYSLSVTYDL